MRSFPKSLSPYRNFLSAPQPIPALRFRLRTLLSSSSSSLRRGHGQAVRGLWTSCPCLGEKEEKARRPSALVTRDFFSSLREKNKESFIVALRLFSEREKLARGKAPVTHDLLVHSHPILITSSLT
jgi:hypothetical protein